MSATETAKELFRIAQTHGLAKDVIDLMEKKMGLLADQVAALEQENTTLLRENRNFATENKKLTDQLQSVRPKGEFDEKTLMVLKYFFDTAIEISDREIAQQFQITMSVAAYHTDVLYQKKFIRGLGFIFGGGEPKYTITSDGRAYCVENGLAN